MLNRLRDELISKQGLHDELVKKYDEKVAAKEKINAELLQIEKELIHLEGAMDAINSLGMELLEKEENNVSPETVETVPAEQVEIV